MLTEVACKRYPIRALLGMLARLPWGRRDMLSSIDREYGGVYLEYVSLIHVLATHYRRKEIVSGRVGVLLNTFFRGRKYSKAVCGIVQKSGSCTSRPAPSPGSYDTAIVFCSFFNLNPARNSIET